MPYNSRLAFAANVALLLLLRFMQKTMEYQFIVLAGKQANATNGEEAVASATSWAYTCRYLLPVFGGLLACRLGHVRVMQIGGGAMLASALLLTAAVYQDQWRGGAVIALGACLVMVVYNGLIIPTVMHGVLSRRTQPRYRTALCALIYMSSAAGLYAGGGVSSLPRLMGHHYAIVCIGIAVAYLALALLALPRLEAAAAAASGSGGRVDANINEGFDAAGLDSWKPVLTMNRLKRCCMVFGALTPYLLGVCDDRATVFKAEVEFLGNASGDGHGATPDGGSGATPDGGSGATPDGGSGARNTPTPALLVVGLVTVNALQVLGACVIRRRGRRLPIRPRLFAGLALQAALELALVVVSSGGVRFASAAAVDAFYTAASVLDGLNAALVMVAAYELMDGFERDPARPLVVGVMLTVWGLANVASRLLITLCQQMPPGNPILRPSGTQQPLVFVYHIVLLVLIVGSVVYYKLCAFPVADSLTVNYDIPSELELDGAGLVWQEAIDEETKPLMGRESARSGLL